MPREAAVIDARRRLRGRRRPLRVVPAARPRIVDVAMFYGQRSGGIRTYLDAKARWARESGAIDHHLVVPGARERHEGGMHELPSLRLRAANGYRLPLGAGRLQATLRDLQPDIVLLHDPFWRPLGAAEAAHAVGARVVAVHHGSLALDAAGLPGPDRLWRPLLRRWMHHAYAQADHVMSAVPCAGDCGRPASLQLRFGLHAAFWPQPVRRSDHVLYVGRLAREKGVAELLHAAARAEEPWPVRLVGGGPAEDRLARLARRLGIAGRVEIRPYVPDASRLARIYASARAVAMPGAHETFGLAAFEAAACGASVVTCSTAPSAQHMRGIAHTYEPGDVDGLLAAVEAARATEPDAERAAALAMSASWPSVFGSELEDLARVGAVAA